MTDSPPQPGLRVAFVPGVTLRKWTRAWEERHPEIPLEVTPTDNSDAVAALHGRASDLSFVRLPIDREGLSVIRLYGEVAVLVVPRDSELAGRESLSLADVSGLDGVVEYPPSAPIKDAVALVAAGVGALRLPHSLARLHARKDVAAVPISDAAETEIALAWIAELTTADIEEFVGIVRGRTAASSRSGGAEAKDPAVKPKTEATKPKVGARKAHRVTGNRAQARKRKGRAGR